MKEIEPSVPSTVLVPPMHIMVGNYEWYWLIL